MAGKWVGYVGFISIFLARSLIDMDIAHYSPLTQLLSKANSHDNPLTWPLLSLLEDQPQHWKVHYLVTALREKGLLGPLDDDESKDLFKRNFLTMNALYQLQVMLLPTQWLQVQSMDIFLTMRVPANVELTLRQDESLRDYYLDWANYDASGDLIKEMLKSFWHKYNDYIGDESPVVGRAQALQVFGLTSDASTRDIRKRWRKLALQWHPDRAGGDSENFRQACRAWQTLRLD
jgi:hypothetical protein